MRACLQGTGVHSLNTAHGTAGPSGPAPFSLPTNSRTQAASWQGHIPISNCGCDGVIAVRLAFTTALTRSPRAGSNRYAALAIK
jgi:hypothetical protein